MFETTELTARNGVCIRKDTAFIIERRTPKASLLFYS